MRNEISSFDKDLIIRLAEKGIAVKKIIEEVFKEPHLDARSELGRAVKVIIQEAGISPNTRKRRVYEEDFILTDEQKSYIVSNYGTLTIPEIRDRLFPGSKKQGREWHAIAKHASSLKSSEDQITIPALKKEFGGYVPPKGFEAGVALVKKATNNPNFSAQNLPKPQRIAIENMVLNIGIMRFSSQINSYAFIEDRDLFQLEFVRLTWNKEDLTAEDISQYIDLCAETVNRKNVQKSITDLVASREYNNEKMTMTSVEAEKSLRGTLDDCSKRIKSLSDAVSSKRSDRLKNKSSKDFSIINLVEYWKDEENRKKLIRTAELKRQAKMESLKDLSTMEDVVAEIWGVDEDEFLFG